MTASIILALHLMGLIAANQAAAFLLIMGVLLIATEIVFPSGIIAFNGAMSLYVAYSLRYGQGEIFGYPFSWEVVFGIALVEFIILSVLIAMIVHYRRKASISGKEGMIGHKADVVEWFGSKGRVRLQGEIWKAASDHTLDLKADDTVVVESIDNLTLKIKA